MSCPAFPYTDNGLADAAKDKKKWIGDQTTSLNRSKWTRSDPHLHKTPIGRHLCPAAAALWLFSEFIVVHTPLDANERNSHANAHFWNASPDKSNGTELIIMIRAAGAWHSIVTRMHVAFVHTHEHDSGCLWFARAMKAKITEKCKMINTTDNRQV